MYIGESVNQLKQPSIADLRIQLMLSHRGTNYADIKLMKRNGRICKWLYKVTGNRAGTSEIQTSNRTYISCIFFRFFVGCFFFRNVLTS